MLFFYYFLYFFIKWQSICISARIILYNIFYLQKTMVGLYRIPNRSNFNIHPLFIPILYISSINSLTKDECFEEMMRQVICIFESFMVILRRHRFYFKTHKLIPSEKSFRQCFFWVQWSIWNILSPILGARICFIVRLL